jgi:KaiC/GvpD/RAD55 family RecA-like ATPase
MALVHGLDNFPKKSVILIEEDLGLAKSIYAQYIASEAAADGKDIFYITARAADEIRNDMKLLRILPEKGLHIEEMHGTAPGPLLDTLTLNRNCNLVIVDQFALYFLDTPLSEFQAAISRLLTAAKAGPVFLLLVDRGVLPERHEALLRAMADGIIQVTTVVEGDKLKRFLNIPKMQGAKLSEKMLPFTVSEEGFLIDTRERHG